MKNIKIEQIERNRWVVKADTKRFGKNEIMFEGTYDECFAYIEKVQFIGCKEENFTVEITGTHCGFHMDGTKITVHQNGFIEQDWDKVLC